MFRKTLLKSFLLVPLGLAAGVSAEPNASRTATESDIPAFLQRLDDLRKEAGITGMSVAVVKDQALLLAVGLGHADVENRVPSTADTAYDIASVAKPLSAVLALRLAEDGIIDLDRPIAEYSDWQGFCTDFSRQSSVFAAGLRCQPATHTLRHLLSHTAAGTPGHVFSYNPVFWASRPIMAAAGDSFSTLVERHVFGPAGMARSARKHRELPLREEVRQQLAPPYRLDSSGSTQRAPVPGPQGDGAAGGVVATVVDLARFDIALDQNALISAQSRTEMMTPMRSDDGDALPYGLGWYVQEYREHTLVWHSGWWEDAYSALYLKVPALKVTLILLANSEGIWWDNPLDQAEVHRSQFAQAFLSTFSDM